MYVRLPLCLEQKLIIAGLMHFFTVPMEQNLISLTCAFFHLTYGTPHQLDLLIFHCTYGETYQLHLNFFSNKKKFFTFSYCFYIYVRETHQLDIFVSFLFFLYFYNKIVDIYICISEIIFTRLPPFVMESQGPTSSQVGG